jgi:hypothetical protein
MRLSGEAGGFPNGAVLGAVGVAAAALVGLLHLDRLPMTLCLFKRWTGLPCATCGSTRALAHLYHLDVAGAFAMNPLATSAAFLVALWCLGDLLLLVRGRVLSLDLTPREATVVQVGTALAFVSNWIYVIAAGR